MATLTPSNIVQAGLAAPTLAAAAAEGGDKFKNPGDQRTFLIVANASGGSINVTVTAQRTAAQVSGFGTLTLGNIVVAVPNGATRWIGPFPEAFNDAAGFVNVGYSGVSSVTVGAVRLPAV